MFTPNLYSGAYVSTMGRYDLQFTWIICSSIQAVLWHFLTIFLMSERLGNVKHMSDLGVFRIFRVCLIQESMRSKGGSTKIF